MRVELSKWGSLCGGTIDDVDLVHFWRRGINEGWLPSSSRYTDFSIQRQLCEMSRSPRPISGEPHRELTEASPAIVDNYAFHLDAGRLARFIRSIAIADGVEHVIGHVAGADLNETGELVRLNIENQSPLEADFFFDCSGHVGILIAKVLQSEWTDWSDQLLCDRAVTARIPHAMMSKQPESAHDAVTPYTVSTGRSAGWTWQIPLNDATGTGYVYSSRHISDDHARLELALAMGISPLGKK